ncbi:hypothetical protein [Glaciecola petra]|uniref:Uncharacterized protein n=1 Tax=Glaciecola petra TaxID=3075602 RepID=A0ABU2ZRK2_9ALTE|nr:hypothetical protein [Aestuariibacter sp. P117]MDT0595026.1 hypothetical protein [Aestuariibacter sp. P117]
MLLSNIFHCIAKRHRVLSTSRTCFANIPSSKCLLALALIFGSVQAPFAKDELATNLLPTHKAEFGELVYLYFQKDYQQVLQLTEVGLKQHGFTGIDKADTDRLNLMQGASQLQLGLYAKSQEKFASLLSQTTSDYVQAKTWFFMAKAGFNNKQTYLSEQAYAAIAKDDLRDYLSNEQWFELLYLTAHTRMQNQQDWQSLFDKIPKQSIFAAYLLANHATMLFNQGAYEESSNTFMRAKQALIAHQNSGFYIVEVATDVYDSITWAITPWRWFDENAIAQQATLEREEQQLRTEQDALFDRINIGLGQSLLQQADLGNAIAVIRNIASEGAEADQALLAYGWANARENRWQEAMSAWQYMQENTLGLSSLQASYGLAYAYGQQDNLGRAFFALQTTTEQIDNTTNALEIFSSEVNEATFFDQYNERWPAELADLKLDFFALSGDFDAKYLLDVRQQSIEILKDIEDKKLRLKQLEQMLDERTQSFQARQQELSLDQAQAQLDQAQQNIDALHALLAVSDDFESQLMLSKRMASNDSRAHIERLDNAIARHTRLKTDPAQKRPVRPRYQTRLDRLEGILIWQLMDNIVAQKWEHQKLLKEAENAMEIAKAQYQNLQAKSQAQDAFSAERQQFKDMNEALNLQSQYATDLYTNTTKRLSSNLLALIEERQSQLQQQVVNTRLAMLRIQDLTEQGAR